MRSTIILFFIFFYQFLHAQVIAERSPVILFEPSNDDFIRVNVLHPNIEEVNFVNGMYLVADSQIVIKAEVETPHKVEKIHVNGTPADISDNGIFSYPISIEDGQTKLVSVLVFGNDGSLSRQELFFQKVKQEKRIALVIGNNSYTNAAPLTNPQKDAEDMAETLRALNFEVMDHYNLGYSEMNDALRTFSENIEDADVVWFYFAGHGIEVDNENFLVPIDAKIDNKQKVPFQTLKMDLILQTMESSSGNGLNILILDACRNNPFKNWNRSGGGGLANIQNVPSGTVIGYATAPGSLALDGQGQNGLYTAELIKQMQKPQRLLDIFRETRNRVEELSDGKQIPWVTFQLKNKYYLK